VVEVCGECREGEGEREREAPRVARRGGVVPPARHVGALAWTRSRAGIGWVREREKERGGHATNSFKFAIRVVLRSSVPSW